MILRNKEDKQIYLIKTEDDRHGEFRIYAVPKNCVMLNKSFVMHYRTLKEFTDEWEDVDD